MHTTHDTHECISMQFVNHTPHSCTGAKHAKLIDIFITHSLAIVLYTPLVAPTTQSPRSYHYCHRCGVFYGHNNFNSLTARADQSAVATVASTALSTVASRTLYARVHALHTIDVRVRIGLVGSATRTNSTTTICGLVRLVCRYAFAFTRGRAFIGVSVWCVCKARSVAHVILFD